MRMRGACVCERLRLPTVTLHVRLTLHSEKVVDSHVFLSSN